MESQTFVCKPGVELEMELMSIHSAFNRDEEKALMHARIMNQRRQLRQLNKSYNAVSQSLELAGLKRNQDWDRNRESLEDIKGLAIARIAEAKTKAWKYAAIATALTALASKFI